MKTKIEYTLLLLFFSITVFAQNGKTKEWDDVQKKEFKEKDIKNIFTVIESSTATLVELKSCFDEHKEDISLINPQNLRSKFLNCKEKLKDDSVKLSGFLHLNGGKERILPFYLKPEINDYKYNLNNLNNEMEKIGFSGKPNTFSISSFLFAYYNTGLSRTLLVAGINNLDNFLSLKKVTDDMTKFMDSMDKKVDATIIKVDTTFKDIQKMLVKADIIIKKGDRIDSQNVKIDSGIVENKARLNQIRNIDVPEIRRKTKLWGVLGGLIGGAICGILVLIFK